MNMISKYIQMSSACISQWEFDYYFVHCIIMYLLYMLWILDIVISSNYNTLLR